MKSNRIYKSCPNYESKIPFNFYRNREEIIQCPNCEILLKEKSSGVLISGIIFFLGGFFATGSKWIGIPTWMGLLIMLLAIYSAFKIIHFKTIKKDLIIRNKLTNQISYINNSVDGEINFEIIEYLNT